MSAPFSGLSVRFLLRLAVGLMAGLLLAMVLWQALMIYLPQYRQAVALETTNTLIDELIAASLSHARERDYTVAYLAGGPLLEEALDDARENADAALNTALGQAQALPGAQDRGSPLGQALADLTANREAVQTLRQEMAGRRQPPPGQAFSTLSEMVEAENALRQTIIGGIGGRGDVSMNNAALKQALWRSGEQMGRERAILAWAIAAETSLDSLPAQVSRRFHAAGQNGNAHWRDALQLIHALDTADNRRRAGDFNSLARFFLPNDESSLRQSIGQARRAADQDLGEAYQTQRDSMLAQAETADYQLDAGQWLEQSASGLDALEVLIEAVSQDARSRARDSRLDGIWSLWTALIMLLAGLILSGLALMIVEGIGRRLHSLSTGMNQAARSHDLTFRATTGGRKELDDLARAFNYMLAQFEDMIRDISYSADTAAAEIRQLLETARSLEHGAESQDRDLDQLAAAMNQMATAVDHVADSTGEGASSANQADQTAVRGREIVGEAVGVIRRLHEESRNISKVLEAISEIASQTNMLSLNASVEAARAKEHGRGFAVVADEVRRLANKTREATAEVHALLQQFQDHSEKALAAMAGSDNEKDTENADRALEHIVASVTAIRELNSQVAMAAKEQSQVAGDMNRRINRIASVSQSTSQSAQDSAGAVSRVEQTLTRLNQLAGTFHVQPRRPD